MSKIKKGKNLRKVVIEMSEHGNVKYGIFDKSIELDKYDISSLRFVWRGNDCDDYEETIDKNDFLSFLENNFKYQIKNLESRNYDFLIKNNKLERELSDIKDKLNTYNEIFKEMKKK